MWNLALLTCVTFILLDLLYPGLCLSPAALPAEHYTPQQTRITLGNTTSDRVIMWSTRAQCTTLIRYGSGPFTLNNSRTGENIVLKNVPQNASDYQVIHHVVLAGLQPGTIYYYMPVCNDYSAGPYFFKTEQNLNEHINLLVFSDVQTSSPVIHSLVQEALTGKYSALMHLGNIAMNLSSDNGNNGDQYIRFMEQAIRTVPYLTAPGPSEVENGTYLNYLKRFSSSHEWPMNVNKLWYSIDIGSVHLISYSTEGPYSESGKYPTPQHDWLIADLKAANNNRKKVPWIIVFGHRPMYCTYEDTVLSCNKKISVDKSEFEDMFYHYGVDVVIQSYGKTYERTFPMYRSVLLADNYTNPLGPVYVVSGGASPWTNEHNFTTPAPAWSAFRYINNTLLTFGRIHIVNDSMLKYEQINATDGSVIDTFEIIQEKHGLFSFDDLSANVSAEIKKERIQAGEKPGSLNIEEVGAANEKTRLSELHQADNTTRLIIGVSCAAFVVVSAIIIIFIKVMKKKKKVARRWEQMDINYGKKFYSKAPEKDEDNDFEIDMSDGTEPSRKLLNADD